MNREKIKSTLLEALDAAGRILTEAAEKPRTIERKTELSLVTETDKNAEAAVIQAIRAAFPKHAILTEESPPMAGETARWIIDPLDGTTNFAHGFPVACTSIGYEEGGELVMGGVFDPFRRELFFGEKGKGAFLNGKPIRVSQNRTLRDSLIATGFPYDRRERMDSYLTIFKDFMMKVQDVRRPGAAALDLCYVASGRYDGFYEFQLQPWDKAAGMVILQEAGGRLSNYKGEPLTLTDMQNLATNGLVHDEMLEVLRPYRNQER